MKFAFLPLAALLAIYSQNSSAFESEKEPYGYQDPQALSKQESFQSKQSDATRIQKFEAALETLNIPLEGAPDFSQFVHANEASQAEIEKNLPVMDPDQGLFRYISMVNGNLQMFRDFFKSMISLDYLEYQQSLSTDNTSNDSVPLIQHLRAISQQAKACSTEPLLGLKILIDPGHMGGDDWDHFTGKYVEVNGVKVSEGDLNLWTALLAAKKLERLGATVKITREKRGAVSNEDPKTFDATPWVNQYFYSSLDSWMAPYLEKSIEEVKTTIKSAPEVSRATSRLEKNQFFITGVDLEARSKMVDAFNPDVTLDIHYDAADNTKLQDTDQSVEAYVPGAFRKNETGSRLDKALALKQILETRRWNQSVELADSVTLAMSNSMGIPRFDKPETYGGFKVRDGVYTRNLYITKRALSSLMVYLECMHYDHVNEFSDLAKLDGDGEYHSVTFKYPKRLDSISDGIADGFLDYFEHMSF